MSACQMRRTGKAEGKTKVTAGGEEQKKNRKRIPLRSPSNPVRASGDPPPGKRETQEMGHKRAFLISPRYNRSIVFTSTSPASGSDFQYDGLAVNSPQEVTQEEET